MAESDRALVALATAIDLRDASAFGHSGRVAEYAVRVGEKLGLSRDRLRILHYGGLLHDVGKLVTDDRALRKRGPLDMVERAKVMEHSLRGVLLLGRAGVFPEVLPVVKYHHEWYGGGGYPEGLRGEAIPLEAAIVGVADALEAMTNDRPYRVALPVAEAMERLRLGKGLQFHPEATGVLLGLLEEGAILLPVAGNPPLEILSREREEEAWNPLSPTMSRELAVMYRISLEAGSILDLEPFLQRTLEILRGNLGPAFYAVYLRDEETGYLVRRAALGVPSNMAEGEVLTEEQGIPGWAVRYGKPVVAGDVARHPLYRHRGYDQARSEAAVPLVAKGEAIGVLNIISEITNAFGEEETMLMVAVAGQLAGAVTTALVHARIAQVAIRDGLTGIYNHSYFYQRMEEEISRTQRRRGNLSLVIFDVNGLKSLNDNYGHLAGDAALKAFARAVSSDVRLGDVFARYGGDEFALLMPDTVLQEGLEVVTRLTEGLEGKTFRVESGPETGGEAKEFPLLQVAWGVASYPEDGMGSAEMVAAADLRMYRNKIMRKTGEGRKLAGDDRLAEKPLPLGW